MWKSIICWKYGFEEGDWYFKEVMGAFGVNL